MHLEWIIALMPVVALIINVMTQILTVHLFHQINKSIVCGIFSGLTALVIGCLYFCNQHVILTLLTNTVTYFALSFCFFAFLNLNLTSMRIRVVRELNNANDGAIELQKLINDYSPQELYSRRITRLLHSKQIVQTNNRWHLQSKKLLILVLVSNALRQLILPGIQK